MGPLTEKKPKPLLEVNGKSLLEHKLAALPEEVDEVIIVIGYRGEMIRDKFGASYGNITLRYVRQENPTGGTAEALWLAKDLLRGKFLVMNGDNIYAREDIEKCIKSENWSVLVGAAEAIRTGAVIADESGRVLSIVENTEHSGKENYANTALYVLDTRVFDYDPKPKAAGSSELGLPQTFIQAAQDIPIKTVQASGWVEIKEPSDLEKASVFLTQRHP